MYKLLPLFLFSCLLSTVKTTPIFAAPEQGNDKTNGMRTIPAHKVGNEPIQIDGVLDDAAWKNATFASDFIQTDPDEGVAATEQTKVAFYYDQEAIYIAARMFSKDPSQIRAQVSRRDSPGSSERIIISLDTYLDRITAYSFGVTAGGTRIDYYHPSDRNRSRDYSFNPVWKAKVRIDNQGWTAEMRIPLSQLRYSNATLQTWGLNINRWSPTTNEDSYWIFIPKNSTGWTSRFGTLVGIETEKASRRIEILPFVASDATLIGNRDLQNPFLSTANFKSRIGADIKMGLGSNLTFEAAINPDFGQVEADPAVVNLSAFETFFAEKRPFFSESSQLFRGRGPQYFYSRRIGARPSGNADGDYVDMPDNTTILGASKISGRLASGLSLGILTALTSREYAQTFSEENESFGSTRVEPHSGFSVIRLQQEYGESQSTAGLTLAGVRRGFGKDDPLAEILNRSAISGGTDWNIRIDNGAYNISGHLGFSYVEGDTTSIQNLQQSTTHYFQRPDASHVEYDPTRTSLAGYGASMNASKNSGEHWLWSGSVNLESPSFDLNDVGRIRSADDIFSRVNLIYRENTPGRIFRNYNYRLNSSGSWNFGGIRQHTEIQLDANYTLLNYWRMNFSAEFNTRALNDGLTRGGPLMKRPARLELEAGFSNSHSAKTNWRLNLRHDKDELGGWAWSLRTRLSFLPTQNINFSVDPGFGRSVNPRQYFTTLENGREQTFGNRYIFSSIRRSTISTRLRLNCAITPDLSIEAYAEPFASSGYYSDYGELLAPGSMDLLTYEYPGEGIEPDSDGNMILTSQNEQIELENKDFNRLSFRSNLVVRWEWQPGSTFFLVWQQNRSSDTLTGAQVDPSDIYHAFVRPEGDNFFALKMSYWLPVH